ncbi:MAG: DUF2628 domain-containing protein [Cytophagaceae bacterium]|nr:DUF2628 domain-containing protein [Cytophagaceae bacterium]
MNSSLQDELQSTNDEQLRTFFGTQVGYYLDVTQDLRDGIHRYNMWAFFLGILWILYRKMYAVFFITVLLIILEQQVEDWLFPALANNSTWNTVFNLGVASTIGFLGNRLYIRHALGKIEAVRALNLDEEQTQAELRRQGGTSWAGPLIFLGFLAVVLYLALAAGE